MMLKTEERTETAKTAALPHNLILEQRGHLTATGVTRVLSCNEDAACVETALGRLTITGQQLSVSELSLETGEIRLAGRIDQIEYAETRESAGGFFRRLVR